jgi:hypothetical protein
LTIVCDSGTTTTTSTSTSTSSTTSTTTSAGVTYDHYYADKYDCATCTLQETDVLVSFVSGTSVTTNKWYSPETPDNYAYQIKGSAPSGPGLIMYASTFNSCGLACAI